MRIVSIVGARPQYIKLASLSEELAKFPLEHLIINTGQHYDDNLAADFFGELSLPKPKVNLAVGSAASSDMTAKILVETSKALKKLTPDLVVVFGDTNSTLGGALAAAQLNLPIAHIEAGLRCFDMSVPEELNRVLTGHLAKFHFCPNKSSVSNLKAEGISKNVYITGDIIYDIMNRVMPDRKNISIILHKHNLKEKQFLLITIHRADAVDNKENLIKLVEMLETVNETMIFPMHPRTKRRLQQFKLWKRFQSLSSLQIIQPCGYQEILALASHARMVLTDSGGLQREAYRLRTPVLIIRNVTEWREIVENKGGLIIGLDKKKLRRALIKNDFRFSDRHFCKLGASKRIATHLYKLLS